VRFDEHCFPIRETDAVRIIDIAAANRLDAHDLAAESGSDLARIHTRHDTLDPMNPKKLVSDEALRAAKLSRIPGMTLDDAKKRFGVKVSAIRDARKDTRSDLSLAELALAALTDNGAKREGKLDSLTKIASWIDYVNHDGSTESDVRRLLAECAKSGLLAIEGKRWRLLVDWP
jgi:hypothetical protein